MSCTNENHLDIYIVLQQLFKFSSLNCSPLLHNNTSTININTATTTTVTRNSNRITPRLLLHNKCTFISVVEVVVESVKMLFSPMLKMYLHRQEKSHPKGKLTTCTLSKRDFNFRFRFCLKLHFFAINLNFT